MTTGAWTNITDLKSRIGPDQKIAKIAEYLSQCNQFLDDLPMKESNEIGGEEFIYRTSIPTGNFRALNQGTPGGKTTTAKGRVGMAELTGLSQIDQVLADQSGDPAGYRETEDQGFLEGMAQTLIRTYFYGNSTVDPRQFMGLSAFYNTASVANAPNAANVLNAGGTGSNNCSIWGVGWSPNTFYSAFPRGTVGGLHTDDKGNSWPAYDSFGNPFRAYTAFFTVFAGLVPKDWRYAFRIANIDTTAAGLAGPNAYDLFAGLGQAMLFPPTMTAETSGITTSDAPGDAAPAMKWVMYANRTARHWMDIQAIRNRQVLLTPDQYAGKPVMRYRGIRINVVDQLLNTEARVV